MRAGVISAVTALGTLLVVLFGLIHAGGTEPGRFDGWVPLAEGGWHTVALVIDFAGEPVGAAAVLVALVGACLLAGRRRLAVLAVLGPGAAVAVTALLKPVVGRTIHGPDNLSFPSGHTASATAFAIVFALLLVDLRVADRWLIPVVTVTAGAAMAWSQVALGAHYETDTLGGFAVAVTVVPVMVWLTGRTRVAAPGARRDTPQT